HCTVFNAGNITLVGNAKLKARGDFVTDTGITIEGGTISLTSTGAITLQNGSLIDVSGDGAGMITMVANGVDASGLGINLINGSTLQGVGQSSLSDEGEKFTDGGTVDLTAKAGGIFDSAVINLPGA